MQISFPKIHIPETFLGSLSALVILISLFTITPAANAQQVTDEYMARLEARINKLQSMISREKEGKKRFELASELNSLYDVYYFPQVKYHKISKEYPKLAAKIAQADKFTEAQRKSILNQGYNRRVELSDTRQLRTILSSPWPILNISEKTKICEQAVSICLDDNKLRHCRFALARCKPFIDEEVYKDINIKVRVIDEGN